MADYKAMYLKLFNAITDAVKILQQAQAEAEKMYIDHEPSIKLLRPDNGGDESV